MNPFFRYFCFGFRLTIHLSLCGIAIWPFQILSQLVGVDQGIDWIWQVGLWASGMTSFAYAFVKLAPTFWNPEDLGFPAKAAEQELAELGL